MTGVVIAGGRGRRMGGVSKPAAKLAGRRLIDYPLSVLCEVCDRVAVVCKRDTVLERLPDDVERWNEPDEPRHPAAGIAHGLEVAGAPVLVCAADMPFVTPEALRQLAAVPGTAVAFTEGRLQPVLGVYTATDLDTLEAAPSDAPLTRSVETLKPALVELPAAVTRSIDTPEELAAAESELGRR